MGLRKSTRKAFRLISFNLRFYKNIRLNNLNPDNLADPIILNPSNQDRIVEIPKIIWMYWDSEVPEIVQQCFLKIKKLNPEYQINILNNQNIKDFCDFDFSQLTSLTPQQYSDLLRFNLLYTYGGIWLDASIIIYNNLDWIIDLCGKNKTAAFGYYRAANVTVKNYPVIENWLLASEKNNIFFKLWFNELLTALKIGPKNYISNIKKMTPNSEEYFQNIGLLEYLIAYVACQKILRVSKPSITLINCDKNAFFYQNINIKSNTYFIEALVLRKKPETMPHLIKLIGADRSLLTPYLLRKKYKAESLLDFSN